MLHTTVSRSRSCMTIASTRDKLLSNNGRFYEAAAVVTFTYTQAQAKVHANQISLCASVDYAQVISRTGIPELTHHSLYLHAPMTWLQARVPVHQQNLARICGTKKTKLDYCTRTGSRKIGQFCAGMLFVHRDQHVHMSIHVSAIFARLHHH